MPPGGNDRSRGPRAFSEADASRKPMRGGDRPVGARPIRHGTAIRSRQPHAVDVEPVSRCPEFTSAEPPDQAPIPRPDGSFAGFESCGGLDAGAAPINSPSSEPSPTGCTALRDQRYHMRHAIWPLALLATSAPSVAQPARDVPPSPSPVPGGLSVLPKSMLSFARASNRSRLVRLPLEFGAWLGKPKLRVGSHLPRKARTEGSPAGLVALPPRRAFSTRRDELRAGVRIDQRLRLELQSLQLHQAPSPPLGRHLCQGVPEGTRCVGRQGHPGARRPAQARRGRQIARPSLQHEHPGLTPHRARCAPATCGRHDPEAVLLQHVDRGRIGAPRDAPGWLQRRRGTSFACG